MPALSYVALGLAGEAGEVANKMKKVLRHDPDYVDEAGVNHPVHVALTHTERTLSEFGRKVLLEELADVQWYVLALLEELGSSPGELERLCREKLTRRKKNNTLQGDGDAR